MFFIPNAGPVLNASQLRSPLDLDIIPHAISFCRAGPIARAIQFLRIINPVLWPLQELKSGVVLSCLTRIIPLVSFDNQPIVSRSTASSRGCCNFFKSS